VALQYTGDQLIKTVRNRAKVPNISATGTLDADLLRFINEAMKTELVPFVIERMEDYFVLTETIALSGTISRYRIPKRAIGNKLRELKYRYPGTTIQDEDLPRISRENASSYLGPALPPAGFYLEGNDIVLVPDISGSGGSLLVSYFFRPGDIQLEVDVRQVTARDLVTKTVTIASKPAAWSNASIHDIHSSKSGAEIKCWGLTVSSSTSTTITFNEAIDGTASGSQAVEVGDWLCIEEEAALPALPRELHPVLAQAVVCSIKESQGDFEALEIHMKVLNRMLEGAKALLKDRVEGESPKITGNKSVFWAGAYRHPWGI
jgi:hypothetical protein